MFLLCKKIYFILLYRGYFFFAKKLSYNVIIEGLMLSIQKKGVCMYIKKFMQAFSATVGALLLMGWATPEGNREGDVKQKVNFYGTLITWQGTKYHVDNIAIVGKYRHIPMYDKPLKMPKKVKTNTTNGKKEIPMTLDPHKELVTTKIDLDEISEIHVPRPHEVWIYQPKGKRRYTYIEVEIISKNKERTKQSYLIDDNIKVTCDEINTAGPVEKEVPLSAIKQFIIEGYSVRGAPTSASASAAESAAANTKKMAIENKEIVGHAENAGGATRPAEGVAHTEK